MAEDPDGRITCATYTHARRHPMVLGRIGEWAPPFQLTLPQVGVIVVSFVVEVWTWRWWGARLHPVPAIMACIGLPWVLAWAVRRARVEGRSLPRAAVGWLLLAVAPRHGVVGGRRNRPARPVGSGGKRVYVAAAEENG